MKCFCVILVILMMFNCFVCIVYAQVEAEPDPALVAAIWGEHQPVPEDWSRITTLFLGGQQLTSLRGLERAVNLQFLSIGHSPISDLTPLANLGRLDYLEIYVCKVRDISPLAGL